MASLPPPLRHLPHILYKPRPWPHLEGEGGSGRGGGRESTIVWEGSFGPDRSDIWPKCSHGAHCVVQVYDGGGVDAGRRFFRCPFGPCYSEQGNCGFGQWVDPLLIQPTISYIDYLHRKIFNLKRKVQQLETSANAHDEFYYNIANAPICNGEWCNCSCHIKKWSPPGGGDAGPSQLSGSSSYYILP